MRGRRDLLSWLVSEPGSVETVVALVIVVFAVLVFVAKAVRQ